MINSIFGRITSKSSSQITIETGGIEWQVLVSQRTSGRIPPVNESGRVLIYLLHREDQLLLYGFGDERERSIFVELQKVGGIGPKQAFRIVGGMTADEFVNALADDDIESFIRVPGLGRKTAQQILLTLKGKLVLEQETGGKDADLEKALVEMGFERKQVEEVLRRSARNTPEGKPLSEEELLKNAIVSLTTGGAK